MQTSPYTLSNIAPSLSTLRYAFLTLLLCLSLGIGLSSCSHQTSPSDSLPSINKVKVADMVDGDTRIEVYADAALHAGYNPLYVRLQCRCDNSILRSAHLELEALMHMSTGMHSAPVEQCESTTPDVDGLYHCAVICTMPSVHANDWEFKIGVHNHKTDTEHELSLPQTIAASSAVQVLKTPDGQEYFCVMHMPSHALVGLNTCRFWIYHHTNETSIMAMSALQPKLGAHMTDMNMSAVGHTQPVLVGDGEFSAEVHLSMRGAWAVDLDVQSGGNTLGKVSFPITF